MNRQAEKKKVLFYYLSAFNYTGGIEKFNRCFIKALDELSEQDASLASIVSVYDKSIDSRYNKNSSFHVFGKSRAKSVLHVIQQAFKYDVVVIGHINLAVAGFFVKLFAPKCKLVIIAHGIEVWKQLSFFKKWGLQKADVIFAVSTYTKNQLVLRNKIESDKIKLFPNTIDPYFDIPVTFSKAEYLLQRYGLKKDQPVILTLSRLVSSEKYKGYDKVIGALPGILKVYPDAKYILAGKYDDLEKKRVEALIRHHAIEDNVIVTGYVNDNEVSDHYCLADVFIMPSRKEGFGIVFLEALACGSQVIGGNQDGTVDALRNGSFGMLINPTRTQEISSSVIELLGRKDIDRKKIQMQVLKKYSFQNYKNRLAELLN